jgi:hypothetical protein
VRHPRRHLVAYGSTNKYRPVNRSNASEISAKRPHPDGLPPLSHGDVLTMTAVKAMESQRWICRTYLFQSNGTSSEDEPTRIGA